ncbi:hypothetical protein QBC34DRAFT_485991 [Podospora aff. communis PSN243]|uniref:Uncharacterized protein n=1 Tax=Podospora aff. communis PSN243 TaxID=3040156 RepID=A0AAV9GKM8_9PEZI|nr:hypothetical protein QBC34DRAFT_485991 [Podospora aff. communis PSN243]
MAPQKVAVVTGAASGIGLALATSLVQKNWLVALLDINTTAGTALATTLGPSTIFIPTDVSSYASQSAAFAEAFTHFGRIDALCANAGIVDRWSLYDLRETEGRAVTDVPPAPDLAATDIDLKGVIYGIRLAVHFMRFNPPLPDGSTPGNKIVVTSSIAGAVPHPALPEYSAAKAGVVGLVRAIAPVLKVREGIAVSVICPGLAATAVLPGFVVDAVGGELLTPVAEVVKAYEAHLEADGVERAGEVLEVVGGSADAVPQPKVRTGLAREMMVAGMEPIFGALHGGESGVDLEGFF